MNDSEIPLLAIKCMAFNHEPYISQCLDGFIMQKTDFYFIAIVHDDASTDSTAEIIKEYAKKYPRIIKPIFECVNQFSKKDGSLTRIINNAIPEGTKYIAYCEGDDFWIDPLKLQKQVNLLEKNPECGLVHTNFNVISDSKIVEYKINQRRVPLINNIDSILSGVVSIGTLTAVYRQEIYNNIHISRKFLMGDLPLWLEIARVSKIIYLPDVTANYRRLDDSASHSSDLNKRMRFIESSLQCRLYYADIFNKSYLKQEIIKNTDISKFKIIALESSRINTLKQFRLLLKKYRFKVPIKVYAFLFFSLIPSLYRLANHMAELKCFVVKKCNSKMRFFCGR